MTYERDIQKTNPVFRNTITPWHENTSTENIESNTEKHLESERDWLSLFCNSFFPLFFSSLFEVRHTKHTKGRLAHGQKHQRSPQHCYWWKMQWCFRHKRLSNTVDGKHNSMKENLWRSKKIWQLSWGQYGHAYTRFMLPDCQTTSFTEWQKTLGREASKNRYLNNNGSHDQCNIYSSISCKPQIIYI